MRIVDDDVSWTSISTTKPEKDDDDDDGDLPVVCIFWGCEDFSTLIPVQGRFIYICIYAEGRKEIDTFQRVVLK